jgi:hypothetical protein
MPGPWPWAPDGGGSFIMMETNSLKLIPRSNIAYSREQTAAMHAGTTTLPAAEQLKSAHANLSERPIMTCPSLIEHKCFVSKA